MKESARISIISLALIISMIFSIGMIIKKTVVDPIQSIENGLLLQEFVQQIEPVRGNIFDKNGELLAGNISSLEVIIIPGFFPKAVDTKYEIITLLADTADLDITWLESILNSELSINDPYQPRVIKRDISSREAIRLGALLNKYPAFEIRPVIRRQYHVSNSGLAHVIGYLGRLDSIDPNLKKLFDYQPTSFCLLYTSDAADE